MYSMIMFPRKQMLHTHSKHSEGSERKPFTAFQSDIFLKTNVASEGMHTRQMRK